MSFPDQIDRIKARAAKATPGPWAWFGNTAVNHIYLATQHWGRHLVMSFQRWGMQGAQPTFFDRPKPSDVSKSIVSDGVWVAASDVPIYEVARNAISKDDPAVYRQDIVGLRNADADFIANARADVDWLIAEFDRLSGLLSEGVHLSVDGIERVRQVGWFCEHRYGTPEAGTHMGWNHKKQKLVSQPNTSSAMAYSHRPQDPARCPSARPMFVAVDAPESGA